MVLMVLRSKKAPNVKSDNKKCTCKIFEDVSFEKSLKLSAAVSLLELELELEGSLVTCTFMNTWNVSLL